MNVAVGLQLVQAFLCGYGGELPTGAAFLDLLALEPEWMPRARPSELAWQSASVELFAVDIAELQAYPEPYEEFAAQVERGFLGAAEWLDSRPSGAFDRWRGQGRKAGIFIRGWLANEQFDLLVPAAFLLACGRVNLPLHIGTND
jgi:hypothetical protein